MSFPYDLHVDENEWVCWWTDTDRGEWKCLGNMLPSITLSATNFTWTGPRLNLGLHFERVVTDYLSHSTAILKPGIDVNNVRYNNSVHYKDQLGTVILRNNCCLPFNVV